ncbi:MAG: response regulator [Candidatus Methanoperedens sp.]|nr:response regulator [Candidatus Methanoperedens sp.]MCZ7403306.1 response regulator [Candidatus Methanoperedens sp.]
MAAKALVLQKYQLDMELVVEMLKATGFIAHGARDAKEAIKMTKNERYDLIIMDAEPLGMEGIELAKLIRDESSYKNVALIVLTANATRREKEKFITAGFDAYMTTPVSVSEFMKTIEKYNK